MVASPHALAGRVCRAGSSRPPLRPQRRLYLTGVVAGVLGDVAGNVDVAPGLPVDALGDEGKPLPCQARLDRGEGFQTLTAEDVDAPGAAVLVVAVGAELVQGALEFAVRPLPPEPIANEQPRAGLAVRLVPLLVPTIEAGIEVGRSEQFTASPDVESAVSGYGNPPFVRLRVRNTRWVIGRPPTRGDFATEARRAGLRPARPFRGDMALSGQLASRFGWGGRAWGIRIRGRVGLGGRCRSYRFQSARRQVGNLGKCRNVYFRRNVFRTNLVVVL